MWALIYNNSVIEITDTDPAGRYHPDISAIDVAGQLVGVDWHYADDKFIPPDLALFLADKRRDALRAIAEKHAEMLIAAMGGATETERDTWPVQLAAAHDIVAGGDGEGVLIPKPGETLAQLAAKVLAKSQMYKRLVGIAGEIKRTAEQEVETLPLQTMDDLAALDAILETAMQRATAALIAAQQPNTESNA